MECMHHVWPSTFQPAACGSARQRWLQAVKQACPQGFGQLRSSPATNCNPCSLKLTSLLVLSCDAGPCGAAPTRRSRSADETRRRQVRAATLCRGATKLHNGELKLQWRSIEMVSQD
eukprot:6186617-Pleurochrysis_carterae.AAC.1